VTDAAQARAIVDAAAYLTLATADEGGRPWASPVWFATADRREFVWVSHPDARHSRNIAARPEVGIVIFDSTQAPGTGAAVYADARAEEVPANAFERCLALYAGRSERDGLKPWTAADVRPPARHRLFRAVATAHWVLGALDERIAVDVGA
jgi:nitroimidazol reductase NimA-like FMN-containing flavoprotein (pyridoxamine 5'-phosphate oxidase superfamily)